MAEHLTLDDAILEVNVTPNRGDCFSVLGIARELAARRSAVLADRAPKPVPPTSNDLYPVALLAGEHCPRFAGRVLKGIRSGATSPFWLRERLGAPECARFTRSSTLQTT